MRFIAGYRALATGLVLADGILATPVDGLPVHSPGLGHTVASSFDPEFASAPAGHFERLESSPPNHSLVTREEDPPAKISGIKYCGQFDTGDRRNAQKLIDSIPREMPNKEWSDNFTMPAKTCTRIKCWNTSGLYMCNPTKKNITVETVSQLRRALNIANKCCSDTLYMSMLFWGSSGEFRDFAGWSAISAYANCNTPPVTRWPSKVVPPRGNPDSECYFQMGTTDGEPPAIPDIPDE
ncbi:hypothetical protein RB595_003891 [Gaeumannomyces hyphopodioides]